MSSKITIPVRSFRHGTANVEISKDSTVGNLIEEFVKLKGLDKDKFKEKAIINRGDIVGKNMKISELSTKMASVVNIILS